MIKILINFQQETYKIENNEPVLSPGWGIIKVDDISIIFDKEKFTKIVESQLFSKYETKTEYHKLRMITHIEVIK